MLEVIDLKDYVENSVVNLSNTVKGILKLWLAKLNHKATIWICCELDML